MGRILSPGVSRGIIVHSGSEKYFRGRIPFEERQRVVMMDAGDFDLILAHQIGALLSNPVPMPDVLREDIGKRLPDEIVYPSKSGPCKLFLDPCLYSLNPPSYVVAKWTDVELAQMEDERFGRRE